MARSSSGFVAGLTAAAVAVVGFLAYQASANVPDTLGKPLAGASKVPTTRHPDKKNPVALPTASGSGCSGSVYSIDDDRVWLVAANNRTERTFKVTPARWTRESAPTPSPPGPRLSPDRTAPRSSTSSASPSSTAWRSASAPPQTAPRVPRLHQELGGIRETRKNGTAMWNFATIGVKVVVIR